MSSASSRRRPFLVSSSTVDGGTHLLAVGDDAAYDEALQAAGTCVLAQVGSGVLFAFLFASLGYVLSGDGTRSLLWLLLLVGGASLGTFATRGAAMAADANPADERACDWGWGCGWV